MSLNVKLIKNESTGFQQPLLEPGMYPAYLVQVIGLGLQEQRAFQGKEKPPKQKVRFVYELIDAFMVDEDGNETEDPRMRGEELPLNSLEIENANSTKRYLAIDPQMEADGDWAALVGKPIMVNLTKTRGKGANADKFYNNIAGTATPRSGDVKRWPEPKCDLVVFDFYEPDVEVLMSQPDWIQKRVKESLDFAGSSLEQAIADYVPKAPEGDDSPEAEEDKKPAKKKEAKAKDVADTEDEEGDEDW